MGRLTMLPHFHIPCRNDAHHTPGLRIKENKEVYEGEVTELTPEYTEAAAGGAGAGAGYGKVRAKRRQHA
eukprot:355129-Chlamydomonas_euryale.AAC.4